VLRAAGETETTQENIQDWLELDEGDPGFQLLTEEGIAVDVIKDSAMKEESYNELDELQESTIKKKIFSSTRDGIDAVTNYVDSSTNKKLQHYEHLRTVREILIKEQQQRSVQTKLNSFFKPALLRSKTSTTSESSIDE
jgi:hypothetical protein